MSKIWLNSVMEMRIIKDSNARNREKCKCDTKITQTTIRLKGLNLGNLLNA